MTVIAINHGCRLNALETEALKRAARAAGREDIAIVNSCAVTAEAVKQTRQSIRRLAREHPEKRIIVTGCAAQTEPETFAAMPEVSLVIGNDAKERGANWLSAIPESAFAPITERVRVNDIMAVKQSAPELIDGFDGQTRAYLQVQNGCDHRCTFCIIPYGRGNSRSVPMGEVVSQARRLAESGFKEIVITGVDITSYGADLPGAPRLGALVKAILKHVPGLPRLRLSSIDSIEADDDLMDALGGEPRFMPHLHLSLQSGDNMILKRMKRRHSRQDAVEFCARAKKLRPDIVFGADIIAGFPTEDEAMFRQSLALVDECGLTNLHVFPYSPRQGTPAARMPEVPRGAIKERAARLREKGRERLAAHLAARTGTSGEVLAERGGIGRLACFTPVKLRADAPPAGTIFEARFAGHDGERLIQA